MLLNLPVFYRNYVQAATMTESPIQIIVFVYYSRQSNWALLKRNLYFLSRFALTGSKSFLVKLILSHLITMPTRIYGNDIAMVTLVH